MYRLEHRADLPSRVQQIDSPPSSFMAASKAWLAGGLLEKSTATEHATSSSSTATEHATFSSSTATEHATSYASASVSSDGVHLAENFAKSQPPASGAVRGKRRATVQVTLTESQYYDLVDIRHPRNCLTSCVGLYHPVLQIQS